MDEYKKFSEFVLSEITTFSYYPNNKDKIVDHIIDELFNKDKYPKLNKLFDQYVGNFS